jgi:hypothetical protein
MGPESDGDPAYPGLLGRRESFPIAAGNPYAYGADPDATWISLDQNPSPNAMPV